MIIPDHVINKNRKYCNIKCRTEHKRNIKLKNVEHLFNTHIDEACYLFGLILGDGHLKKSGEKTTRVTIAFNAKETIMINQAVQIISKLGITVFKQPKIHFNCQMLGFSISNEILEKYKMFWHGCKYDSQPTPIDYVCKNINFLYGLINSDGCFHISKKTKYKSLTINNTVDSIIAACKTCLFANDINFREYKYAGKIDKRNGNLNKPVITINIGRKKDLEKLYNNSGNMFVKGKDRYFNKDKDFNK